MLFGNSFSVPYLADAMCYRDGVRLGQADPCNSCYIQPRTSSGKCIPCDRQAGPAAVSTGSTPPAVAAGGPAEQSLRELNRYGRTFAAGMRALR